MALTKLFISFSSKDADYARAFYLALCDVMAPANVFFAPVSIQAGERYFERIMQALNDSDALVVLSSAHSVGCQLANQPPSKHVMREIKAADDLDMPMFPIDIDGVLGRDSYDPGLRYFLGPAQYINGRSAREFGQFGPVLEPLLAKLTGQQRDEKAVWLDTLQRHLANGHYCDAVAMVKSVCLDSYPARARILAVAAKLAECERLLLLTANVAESFSQQLSAVLTAPDCGDAERALAYYLLGVLAYEYFRPNVIKSPAGSFDDLRRQAMALPRMPLAEKKLVRAASDDFRRFESEWFFA